MRLRSRLIAAFLLLSVVPLSGIVGYSYWSSLAAMRRVTEEEARSLNAEMGGRLAAIQEDLGRGARTLGGAEFGRLVQAAQRDEGSPALARFLTGFGDAAPLLDAVELIPEAPLPGDAVETPTPPPPAIMLKIPVILKHLGKAAEAWPGEERPPGEKVRAIVEMFGKVVEEVGAPLPPLPPEVAKEIEAAARAAHAAEADRHAAEAKKLVLAELSRFVVKVEEKGRPVGTVRATLNKEQLIRRVLERTRSREGEIPFAVEGDGTLHTLEPADRAALNEVPAASLASTTPGSQTHGDWVVVTSKDEDNQLTLGIARRVPLGALRRTAARNFGYGIGLIGLALFGILPLSGRMTRDLKTITEGAERLATGDLKTRVPVRGDRGKDELGKLAAAFNRMAHDLDENQARLLAEEARRREEEVEKRLLKSEYERKSEELEEARRFQLSLLPKSLPEDRRFALAVSMKTATEVGGDYYDFSTAGGELLAAIGDATGHGMRAGTMVTVLKSLFSAYSGNGSLAGFLSDAARTVKRMDLGRMAMAVSLARFAGRTLTVSAAGMPPVLVYRRDGASVEEVDLQGMPLGGLASEYQERQLAVAPGDTVLLMSDGLPELADQRGDPFGYPRVRSVLAEVGGRAPAEVIAGLLAAAEAWTGGKAPRDDITLVVIQVRDTAQEG